MRTISIEITGDATVTIDGTLLGSTVPRQPAIDVAEDALRHDTPIEVVIAATCHEANRQYARSLGDLSMKPWSQCPGWMQATNIEGVRAIRDGRVKTPADSHEAWRALKIDQGWKYGPEKSEVNKTNPNLVPYAELHPEQRRKDLIFFTLASALLSAQ